MDASELRARARQEVDELGPEPPGTEADLCREERWGAVVLLAGLADDDAELLRQAANGIAAEWADREAARLLLDAANRRRDRRVSETQSRGEAAFAEPPKASE